MIIYFFIYVFCDGIILQVSLFWALSIACWEFFMCLQKSQRFKGWMDGRFLPKLEHGGSPEAGNPLKLSGNYVFHLL
jgi:hypothetical protein